MTASSTPNLADLVNLFYEKPTLAGHFTPIDASDCPQPYAKLLSHNHHMTVAMENFHQSLVDVSVLEVKRTSDSYSRKILLRSQPTGKVVQFGIVRLRTEFLPGDVQAEIETEQTPLGRILIDRNVMRQVELSQLWRIEPGDEMQVLMDTPPAGVTYGRTALIYVENQPAVELLEIASPIPS